ncbi:3',5'-cyclic adenosine monophosphate phosphodiesterase CpdA [Alsobacter metallidurans]|uniref:3',5'-cyclic adenosine monophosphate phosphodiesterase CpdA n=1 Tax=Alsobacter metallidurans TaxID=340221 RepID=A0A917MJA6_9HYPH|nr:phosphodiesterase [Alsobacter metallidurans]GGH16361.1 3',5'-cyclic adenosine monophosphate phosphodiesterase CpdA [Alsobacter metallidurans]
MIIVQLSDFHARPNGRPAYGDVDTNAAMRRAVEAVLAMEPHPDCVLVTGDLADCGLPEEYAIVQEALAALPMPVYVIPGNHDRRENFANGLRAGHPYLPESGFLHYVIDDFTVRLIGLDTVIAGEDGGEICAEREVWFAERLAEGEGRPTLVFMHHPPFRVAVAGMDAIPCRTSPGFAALVAAHPEIERVACGHYHRPIQRRFAKTMGYVAPSSAHQVALDLRPGESNRFILEPPAFAVHVWDPEAGLVSHVQPIGDFGPRREFVLDPAYPGHAIRGEQNG